MHLLAVFLATNRFQPNLTATQPQPMMFVGHQQQPQMGYAAHPQFGPPPPQYTTHQGLV